jgi:peptidoglycan-associated lipoprotein
VSPDDVRSTGSPESGGPSARPPGGDGLADVHFAYDQADLTPEAQAILQGHAAWLHGNPGVGLVIEGHCDERGTVEYNLALGARRAEAAREFLAALGIEPSRMRTVSYGKERPLETGGDEAAWARNRRAHFVPER